MKKVISVFLFIVAVLEICVIGYFGFMAYFTVSINSDGSVVDGLGRAVESTPSFIRAFTRQDDWPGFKWFIIDFFAFWMSVFIVYLTFKASSKVGEKEWD